VWRAKHGGRNVTTGDDRDAGPSVTSKVYPLDLELMQGKNRITVKFQRAGGPLGGGVASVRVMKQPVEK